MKGYGSWDFFKIYNAVIDGAILGKTSHMTDRI